ncbi:uncharacterized protein LOC108677495 [Hyalella azteca]|uniref:Uncharacterized protein LOC108677495 n=1 Tax=Hyalella azteca TaxID=294128 RepID=A0A8B7P5J7_HYAAZ|nr:uncharacterized protein LOC108677495 [Hyalella azteca]
MANISQPTEKSIDLKQTDFLREAINCASKENEKPQEVSKLKSLVGEDMKSLEMKASDDKTAESPTGQPNFFNVAERVPFAAPVDGEVDCLQFFAAGDDYTNFFLNFSFLFKVVINEARLHLSHMRKAYARDEGKSQTLRSLLLSAQRRGDAEPGIVLLWFRRSGWHRALMLKTVPHHADVVKVLCFGAAAPDELALFTAGAAHTRHLPAVIAAIDDALRQTGVDMNQKAP